MEGAHLLSNKLIPILWQNKMKMYSSNSENNQECWCVMLSCLRPSFITVIYVKRIMDRV